MHLNRDRDNQSEFFGMTDQFRLRLSEVPPRLQ